MANLFFCHPLAGERMKASSVQSCSYLCHTLQYMLHAFIVVFSFLVRPSPLKMCFVWHNTWSFISNTLQRRMVMQRWNASHQNTSRTSRHPFTAYGTCDFKCESAGQEMKLTKLWRHRSERVNFWQQAKHTTWPISGSKERVREPWTALDLSSRQRRDQKHKLGLKIKKIHSKCHSDCISVWESNFISLICFSVGNVHVSLSP